MDGQYGCGATTVTQTRTVSVTTYVWNAQTQKFDGTTVVTQEARIRDLTASEQFACPPYIPPTYPTPVVYAAPAAAPPTCNTAGSFTLPGNSGLIDWSISPAYHGPGTYTVTATLVGNTAWADGYASRSRSITITVDGQLSQTATSCLVSITPTAAPVATAATCTQDGSLSLPTIAHVLYSVLPTFHGPGTYTVTATPEAGFTIVGPTSWTIEVKAAHPKQCVSPSHKAKASFRTVSYCNTVRVEGRHHVASIEKRHSGNRYVFIGHAKPGALFSNGKKEITKVRHLKTGGGCSSSSS